MTIIKNFAIAFLDFEKTEQINNIISEYANITLKTSSHIHFDTQPVDHTQINQDITYFSISYDDESILDKKLKDLIEELNQENIYYMLRNESTGKIISSVKFVGAIDIKFDNVECIKKGTYKKIDELKTLKEEFGRCLGYKPNFRPVEGNPIGNITIKTESIYLFSHTEEGFSKLNEIIFEKIGEIDSDLKAEFRPLPITNN